VIVKLKIQEQTKPHKTNKNNKQNKGKKLNKNTRFNNHKMFSLLVKVLELFLICPILVLAYKQKL
jgi:hypothetical protein